MQRLSEGNGFKGAVVLAEGVSFTEEEVERNYKGMSGAGTVEEGMDLCMNGSLETQKKHVEIGRDVS